MYGMVLMVAVTGSGDTAGFGKRNSGCDGGCSGVVVGSANGCYGSAVGCDGGCSGRGGFFGLRSGGGLFGKHKGNGCNGGAGCLGTAAGSDGCGCLGSSAGVGGANGGCAGVIVPGATVPGATTAPGTVVPSPMPDAPKKPAGGETGARPVVGNVVAVVFPPRRDAPLAA